MIEGFVVMGVVLALAGAAALRLASPESIFIVGAAIVVLGLLVGVPGSVVYHRVLHRGLAARGPVPRRWWLHPTSLHAVLDGPDRAAMLRWFAVGVTGFVLAITGCGVVFVSAMRWGG